jgi:hypothetical protein
MPQIKRDDVTYADILSTNWPDCGWTSRGVDGDWDQLSWEATNPVPKPSKEEADAKRDLTMATLNERNRQMDTVRALRGIREDIYVVLALRVINVLAQLRKALPAEYAAKVDWTMVDEAASWLRNADDTGALG